MIASVSYGAFRLDFVGGVAPIEGRREFLEFVSGRTSVDAVDEHFGLGGLLRQPVVLDGGSGERISAELRCCGCAGAGDVVGCVGPQVVARPVDDGGSEGPVASGGTGVSSGVCAADPGSSDVKRGPNWERNREWKRKKRESRQRRAAVPEWRRKSGRGVGAAGSSASVAGSAGTVRTVSTECAEEIEARRMLALKRVEENKVAVMLARHRLVSLQDKDKTAALQRLAVARVEERINTTRAKSQASWKKCDSSLKSLGSTGSAGEFALKQVATQKEALQVEVENLRKQVEVALAYGGAAAARAVAEVPEPRKFGIRDVMDPPCEGWTAQAEEAYYRIVDAEDAGNYNLSWAEQFPRPGEFTDEEAAADAARYFAAGVSESGSDDEPLF